MIKYTIILFCALSFCCSTRKVENLKIVNVLFIGNSLTSYNNMPAFVQSMLNNINFKYSIEQCTYNGHSLSAHINEIVDSVSNGTTWTIPKEIGDTTKTEKTLYSKKWDYIILQEGTIRILIPETRDLEVIPAINNIRNNFKSEGTEFILFKTWPSMTVYPKQYCYPCQIIAASIKKQKCCSPVLTSLEDEIKIINNCYDSVAKAINFKTLPITNCYGEILKFHPEINLYDDEIHPSKLGAYLNACVFFKYFTKQKASSIKFSSDINKNVAELIQSSVDKVYP